MRRGLLMLAIVGLLAAPAFADWDHAIKWDQYDPASDWGAWSHLDYDTDWYPQVADDWRCDGTGWITDAHIQGWSYYGSDYVVGFRVSIYGDIPAVPGVDESHPGALLHMFEVGPSSGVVNDPAGGYVEDPAGEWGINFPQTQWFWQEEGNVYWLSVQAIMATDGYQDAFGWNFWGYPNHNEDDAVVWDEDTQTWRHWGWFWADDGAGGLVAEPDLYDGAAPPIGFGVGDYAGSADMSFYLTPEPTTLALLAIGGLALLRRRR